MAYHRKLENAYYILHRACRDQGPSFRLSSALPRSLGSGHILELFFRVEDRAENIW